MRWRQDIAAAHPAGAGEEGLWAARQPAGTGKQDVGIKHGRLLCLRPMAACRKGSLLAAHTGQLICFACRHQASGCPTGTGQGT